MKYVLILLASFSVLASAYALPPCPSSGVLDNCFGSGISSGVSIAGDFKDGKLHGHGAVTWPNGEMYDGKWKNGVFHGQGTYTDVDGNKYVGHFKDGKADGQGTVTYPSGLTSVGQWNDGEFEKLIKTSPPRITDEHIGGLSGVYRAEAKGAYSTEAKGAYLTEAKGTHLTEMLLMPFLRQGFKQNICLMSRFRWMEKSDWIYPDPLACGIVRSLPRSSLSCEKNHHCFTAQVGDKEFFYSLSPDYQSIEAHISTSKNPQPIVLRLDRKNDENYESWLRDTEFKTLLSTFRNSTGQPGWASGTGFSVNESFVVTADHVVRNGTTGRLCKNVVIAFGPDFIESAVEVKIASTSPILDLAVLELPRLHDSVGELSLNPDFNVGNSVSHYGVVDWSAPYSASYSSTGLDLSIGQISSHIGNNTGWFSTNAFIKEGDSGGAILNSNSHVIGVAQKGKAILETGVSGKSTVLEGFLKASRVPYETADSVETLTFEEIEQKAKGFTALVFCKHPVDASGRQEELERDRR